MQQQLNELGNKFGGHLHKPAPKRSTKEITVVVNGQAQTWVQKTEPIDEEQEQLRMVSDAILRSLNNREEVQLRHERSPPPRKEERLRQPVHARIGKRQNYDPVAQQQNPQQNRSNVWDRLGGQQTERRRSPRAVRPAQVTDNRWHSVEHAKFPMREPQPAKLTRTQKRRKLRQFHKRFGGGPDIAIDPKTGDVEAPMSMTSEGHDTRERLWGKRQVHNPTVNMVYTMPRTFRSQKQQPSGEVVSFKETVQEQNISADAAIVEQRERAIQGIEVVSQKGSTPVVVLTRPEDATASHIKPLYICAVLDGVPLRRVMVDNGAAINILPTTALRQLGKQVVDLVPTEVFVSGFTGDVTSTKGILPLQVAVGSRTVVSAFFVVDTKASYNALLGRDWIHSANCVPSSLHQAIILWGVSGPEVVAADDSPFNAQANAVEAYYYDKEVGPYRLIGMDKYGRPKQATMRRDMTLPEWRIM